MKMVHISPAWNVTAMAAPSPCRPPESYDSKARPVSLLRLGAVRAGRLGAVRLGAGERASGCSGRRTGGKWLQPTPSPPVVRAKRKVNAGCPTQACM